MARFADDRVEIRRGVSWSEFEQYIHDKDEAVAPRVCYLDGTLELVTPSRGHELYSRWIGALVTAYALEHGIELSSIGSWLLKDQLRKAGAEPDDCFIVGDDSSNPLERPHFAIEVQWSHRGIDKLEVYRRLGVPEVWFWEKRALSIYVRKGRGAFRKVTHSAALPGLDLVQLVSFLDRPTMTQAIKDYQRALRERA